MLQYVSIRAKNVMTEYNKLGDLTAESVEALSRTS